MTIKSFPAAKKTWLWGPAAALEFLLFVWAVKTSSIEIKKMSLKQLASSILLLQQLKSICFQLLFETFPLGRRKVRKLTRLPCCLSCWKNDLQQASRPFVKTSKLVLATTITKLYFELVYLLQDIEKLVSSIIWSQFGHPQIQRFYTTTESCYTHCGWWWEAIKSLLLPWYQSWAQTLGFYGVLVHY